MLPKFTHQDLLERQKQQSQIPKIPLIVLLEDIRSLENVGSIFRSADAAGIEKIFLCGITGYPPQQGITKSALGAQESVVWEYQKKALSVVQSYKKQGFKIVALEQSPKSVFYQNYHIQKEEKTLLIVGNEISGVSQELMNEANGVVEIPMYGIKNSLNVAVACGIVLVHFSEKLRRDRGFC